MDPSGAELPLLIVTLAVCAWLFLAERPWLASGEALENFSSSGGLDIYHA